MLAPILYSLNARLMPLGLNRRGKARRGTAVAAALAIHLVLLLALLPSARGNQLALGQGMGDGQLDAVTLAMSGLDGATLPFVRHHSAPKPPAADGMDSLFKRLSTHSEGAVRVSTDSSAPDASRLLDLVDDNRPPSPPTDRPAHPDDLAKPGDGGAGTASGAVKGADKVKNARVGGGDGAAAKGAFAGQVENCWKRLPGRSAVAVILEVAIDGRGLIARPPTILRPPASRLDEQRLISEERAIRALSACTPYRGAATAATYHLAFGVSG